MKKKIKSFALFYSIFLNSIIFGPLIYFLYATDRFIGCGIAWMIAAVLTLHAWTKAVDNLESKKKELNLDVGGIEINYKGKVDE